MAVIEPNVFGPEGWNGLGPVDWTDPAAETALAIGNYDTDEAIDAFNRIAARFWQVDELGREFGADPALDVEIERWREAWDGESPRDWVRDVSVWVEEVGITLYVDCWGIIPEPMYRAFHRILREELASSTFTRMHVIVMTDLLAD